MRLRLLLVSLAAFASIGWTSKTEVAIAKRGALLSPPDLARQIRKHSGAFAEGVLIPLRTESSTALRADLAEIRAREIADAIVRKIHDHHPFEEIVRDLGSLAHFTIVAGDPLLSSRDPRIGSYLRDYSVYCEGLLERLPRVHYGIHASALRGEGFSPVFRGARARAIQLAPFVGEEYYRNGSLRRSSDFDDLAVTFGVASISLSRSSSDVASLFTSIWKQANGDVRPLQLAASSDSWRLLRLRDPDAALKRWKNP